MEYYYFAASLPMLSMGKELPITYSAFMEKAKEQLSRKDYEDLQLAVFSSSDKEAEIPIVRSWQEYARSVQSILCRIRAEILGFSGYGGYEIDRTLESSLRSIVENKDPLEGEKAILSLYFDFLTSREPSSPFSSAALMIYALKLQLIEKANAFDEAKGRAEFERLYQNIESNIKR